MREVQSIELVLENCERIQFQREDIGIFRVSNITRSISRRAMNSISDGLSAEEVFIQLSLKANTTTSYSTEWFDSDTLPFTRLLDHRDITGLNIAYQDGSHEYIYVKWGGDSDYTNEYQSAEMNPYTGDLYLVISEKENAMSVFGEQLKEIKSSWNLYSES